MRAVLFDIDGTLYSNDEYARFQTQVLIDEFARVRGLAVNEAALLVERSRAELAAAHGTGTTSLGNAMGALGIDTPTSVAWRSRLIDPSRFLAYDASLSAALAAIMDQGQGTPPRLVAVTNNPRSVGEATLEALGVARLFQRVVGLDDTMKSKPAAEPYLLAAQLAEAPVEECLSVGDRYDVDLSVPLSLGMGAILVSGVEDVYELPGVLRHWRSDSAM
ncbi:MAG: HAD family hydrolase [Spirochaetales bacterium]|nr:HAD family hydrolase [Spirochaetales bacterium]